MAKKAIAKVKPEERSWKQHDWTAEEILFCLEYLRTGSANRAHRHAFPDLYIAGTSKRSRNTLMTATFTAKMLLSKRYVQEYIAEIRADMIERMQVDKKNVLNEIAKLAFSNIVDFVILQEDGSPQIDLSGLTAEQSAAVSELTVETYMEGQGDDALEVKRVKVKLAPKTQALELLGKHLKLFTEVYEESTLRDIAQDIQERRGELARRREKAKKDDEDEDN